MGERAGVGDLVSVERVGVLSTALVEREDESEGNGWVFCRWSPVDARWLPREKVVVISKAYKKKQENRRNIRKAKVAKEIGITAQDLESYTLCFVGIDQLTSSDEERTILNR